MAIHISQLQDVYISPLAKPLDHSLIKSVVSLLTVTGFPELSSNKILPYHLNRIYTQYQSILIPLPNSEELAAKYSFKDRCFSPSL